MWFEVVFVLRRNIYKHPHVTTHAYIITAAFKEVMKLILNSKSNRMSINIKVIRKKQENKKRGDCFYVYSNKNKM